MRISTRLNRDIAMRGYALALLATAGSVFGQGVTEKISPTGAPPSGCTPSFDGKFEITILRQADLLKRDAILNVSGLSKPSMSTCPLFPMR